MKKGSISIYYNSEWGSLVVSDATLYDSVMRVTIPPVMTENNNATEICLGKMALEALKRSRNAMPVMEEEIADFNFWQVSGIKGFSAFSKRFQCVEVKEQETGYHVEQLIRERNGSYVWMKVPMESILIWIVQKSRWGELYIRYFMKKSCLMMDDLIS